MLIAVLASGALQPVARWPPFRMAQKAQPSNAAAAVKPA
jgi:hypothetical protein